MRYQDWPQRLDECMALARKRAFEWGVFDCCLFAADCVLAMTGTDYAESYRGTYSEQAGAEFLLEPYGGSLEALLTSIFGEPVHKSKAMHGDVVLYNGELITGVTGDCIGICLGVTCAFPVARGLRFIPTKQMLVAWRVE